MYFKEIDDLLAGGLTQEDEDDVLSELDEIIKVNKCLNLMIRFTLVIVYNAKLS